MDLLKDNPQKLYFKYLSAALGSTLIMSFYALVDTVVIGQYEGPNGTAAVVTFSPMWNVIFAFGLLFGIGGSVPMAQKRGEGATSKGNIYFTISLIAGIVVSAIVFIVYNFCATPILMLCGARDEILLLALKYAHWVSLASPFFVIGQLLVPFIRNDNAPLKTTVAVVAGGLFNIVGDLFFVFAFDMGISGAGLATALGQIISFLILLTHFKSKNCGLKIMRLSLKSVAHSLREILLTGSSNFIIDLAMGLFAIMFNNQILKYFGPVELSVYGVINNLTMLLQTLSYAFGESSQAIIAVNYGAKLYNRIKIVFQYAAGSAFILGILWCFLSVAFPEIIMNLVMDTTPEVLLVAPGIMRRYAISYILLGFNVNATYYFQAVGKERISIFISLLRGILLGALFIYILPLLFGKTAIWYTMVAVEAVVFVYILCHLESGTNTM